MTRFAALQTEKPEWAGYVELMEHGSPTDIMIRKPDMGSRFVISGDGSSVSFHMPAIDLSQNTWTPDQRAAVDRSAVMAARQARKAQRHV